MTRARSSNRADRSAGPRRGARPRLLIDALGAPAESGGMRLHATEVISQWLERFSSVDDVVVLGGPWVRTVPGIERARRVVVWPNDNAVARMVGQQLVTPLVFLITRRHRLLATNSVLSRIVPRRAATVVTHDWRHLIRPEEFSRVQLLYRRTWRSSARRASHVVAVSEKTRAESAAVLGREDSVTIENGRDHAARWSRRAERPSFAPDGPFVLTFGHHSNKRPELVVDAMAEIAAAERPALVVLGARGNMADRVRSRAAEHDVAEVVLPGFVEDDDYQWLVINALVVVVASSDEGFGLPLAEAAALGVPAVVARDSGVAGLFEGTAVIAEPIGPDLARAIAAALAQVGLDRSAGSTWSETVASLRAVVLGRSREGTSRRPARGGPG